MPSESRELRGQWGAQERGCCYPFSGFHLTEWVKGLTFSTVEGARAESIIFDVIRQKVYYKGPVALRRDFFFI